MGTGYVQNEDSEIFLNITNQTHKMPAFNPSNLSKVVEVWPKISFIPKDLSSRGAWSSRNGIRSTRKEMDPPCQNCSWKFWQVMSGSNSPSQGHKKMILLPVTPKKTDSTFEDLSRIQLISEGLYPQPGTPSSCSGMVRRCLSIRCVGSTEPWLPWLPWPYHGLPTRRFLGSWPKAVQHHRWSASSLAKTKGKIGSFQTMKISPPKPNWLVS